MKAVMDFIARPSRKLMKYAVSYKCFHYVRHHLFFFISHVSIRGFRAFKSHPQLLLESPLWPCLNHVICKNLCEAMHNLKGSLIASRITRPLTVSQPDESRGPCASANSSSLHISALVNTVFYRWDTEERGMGFHHLNCLLVLTAVSISKGKIKISPKITTENNKDVGQSIFHISLGCNHLQLIGGW